MSAEKVVVDADVLDSIRYLVDAYIDRNMADPMVESEDVLHVGRLVGVLDDAVPVEQIIPMPRTFMAEAWVGPKTWREVTR